MNNFNSLAADKVLDRLFISCHHTTPTVSYVACYCILLSSAFVGGLYLIPTDIRHLQRDNERQIKWRMISVLLTCLVATLLYPAVFCAEESVDDADMTPVSALRYLGWSWNNARRDIAILLHVMTLYLGPIAACLAKLQMSRTHIFGPYSYKPRKQSVGHYQALQDLCIRPTMAFFRDASASEKWGKGRDLIVAPLAEEVVFRGCMVAPLLKTGMSPVAVAWTAPLFFGTAHVHHAILKLRDGTSPASVLIGTLFQFAYTALFGAYAAHAFIRTGSILAVYLCHAFCNYMGLPDLSYLNQHGSSLSCVYCFRYFISTSYILGFILFALGFTCGEADRGIVQRLCYFPEESGLLVTARIASISWR